MSCAVVGACHSPETTGEEQCGPGAKHGWGSPGAKLGWGMTREGLLPESFRSGTRQVRGRTAAGVSRRSRAGRVTRHMPPTKHMCVNAVTAGPGPAAQRSRHCRTDAGCGPVVFSPSANPLHAAARIRHMPTQGSRCLNPLVTDFAAHQLVPPSHAERRPASRPASHLRETPAAPRWRGVPVSAARQADVAHLGPRRRGTRATKPSMCVSRPQISVLTAHPKRPSVHIHGCKVASLRAS